MNESLKEMMYHIYGASRTHLLYCAVKMEIIDHLADKAMDAKQLSVLTNTKEDLLYRFLRSLRSMRVLEQNDQIFSVTELGSTLKSNSKHSLKHYLLAMAHETLEQPLLYLDHSLRTGETAFNHVYGKPIWEYVRTNAADAGTLFDKAMKDLSSLFLKELTYDYSNFNRIIDVGGGNGHYLISVLQQNPNSTGIVFDVEGAIENAKAEIEKSDVKKRCSTKAGDFFESVPEGGDCYILRHIVHLFDDQRAIKLLSNIRNVMKADSKLIILEQAIFDCFGADQKTVVDMIIFASSGGKTRTKDELEELGAKVSLKMQMCGELKDCGEIIVEFVPV
ncbi:O-demethylpuromycin-O-methyltransferase-like protein [Leptotrombidium deliense]|uniref:Acetylserotonin O-methyltransferase n=1 Tax=Leptotrombidium deliense TaxID=299467 RepID=A0A443RXD9_9ACAR|nr:O-demethylpuromycin-O-methyltransferase-like protein [Leptotrombidium deliense]